VNGPKTFRQTAINEAIRASKRISGNELADYKGLVAVEYAADIQAIRSRTNDCLQTLTNVKTALEVAQPVQTNSTERARVQQGNASRAGGTAAPSLAGSAQPSQADTVLGNAESQCRTAISFGNPTLFKEFDEEAGTALGRAYQWLAVSPESTVLIIGLVGFGLFGAAIRMMGRPDKTPPPTERTLDQQVLTKKVERNNVVAVREGGLGYEITGAPARVLVQGVGAAFTVFLGGQAGTLLLASGSRPNVYSLLLFCFLGAVFAEEIWGWAQRMLHGRLNSPVGPEKQDEGSAANAGQSTQYGKAGVAKAAPGATATAADVTIVGQCAAVAPEIAEPAQDAGS